jgi:hypothetical protein
LLFVVMKKSTPAKIADARWIASGVSSFEFCLRRRAILPT